VASAHPPPRRPDAAATRRPAHPFLDHPGPIPFAHQGGAADLPENTLVAFARAVRLGYRYLETDVHATSDGVLVAFHDDRLDRVTDRTGRIAELPWSEVRRARVQGSEPIPLLDDLLDAFPDARFNIDAKADTAVDPLVDAIRRHGALDRVCVASFSDRRLTRLSAALGPDLCRSIGPKEVLRLRLASLGCPAPRIDAHCAQLPPSAPFRLLPDVSLVDGRLLAEARRRRLPVHVWTIDDAPTMHRLLDLGVQGIMTNRLEVLKAALVERGEWHG
jgi:glycerophosphoryl diester phosphodiesterase